MAGDIFGMSPAAGNRSEESASMASIKTTFWLVFILQASLPVIVMVLGFLCKKSFKDIINFENRNIYYDTQLLRRADARTSFGKTISVLFYRHRPLPLELLRMSIEVTILLYILGFVRLVVLLSLWCIFDLSQGLHVLNLVYLKHTQSARQATSMGTYIATMYSLLYGFPLGFISKLMWIVWLGSRIAFPTIFVPFYIEAVAALVFALFFMLPNICWKAGVKSCHAVIPRLQVLVLLLSFFGMWLMVYFNVTVCDGPPVVDAYAGTDFKTLLPCAPYFRSWTTSFLSLFILFVVSLSVLLWATSYKGMLYRFLPEISFTWSGSLVFTAAIYSEDVGRGAVLGCTGAAILISLLVSVVVNYILLCDIVCSLRLPLHRTTARTSSVNEGETKRRVALRQSALKDYIHEGGKTILKGTLLRHLKKRNRTKECVVCLETFQNGEENRERDGVNEEEGIATDDLLGIIRKCGHYFHFNCVWDWIQQQNTCPLCRTHVQVTKDAIKTVHYDEVRYALERNRDTLSVIGTVSELVGKADSNRDRLRIQSTIFQNVQDKEEEADEAEGDVTRRGSRAPRRNTAVPPGAYVVGAQSTSYKNRTRSSTKFCGICRDKFLADRQAKDIVVGYLRNCGHFFHCECIDKYVREQEHCPTCLSLEVWHARKSPRSNTQVQSPLSEGPNSEQDRCSPKSHVEHEIVRHSHRDPPGNADERSSRKHQEDTKGKGRQGTSRPRGSSHAGGDWRQPATRDCGPSARQPSSVSTSQSSPHTHHAMAGPSKSRNGYTRNTKLTQRTLTHNGVHSEDILFVFLSDVQYDIKRNRGRKVHSPTSVIAQ